MILSSLNTSLKPNVDIVDSDAAPISTPIVIEDTIYPIESELLYHTVENMLSVNVLKNELNVCESIIEYKIAKGYEKSLWEDKINMIHEAIEQCSKEKIHNKNVYKENIILEIENEKAIIETMKQNEEDLCYKRIYKRIEILEEELKEIEKEDITSEQQKSNREEIKIKKEEIKKSPLYQLLKKRFIEYKSAVDYFKEYNLQEQKKKAIEDATKIIKIIKHIQDKNTTEDINENDIPKEISPEYICGYSMKERLERYRTILLRLLKEKEETAKNYNLGQIQKKKTLKKYDTLINILSEHAKNVWIPAPLYQNVKKVIEPKVNNEIPENSLMISLNNITYDKPNIYLIVTLKNGTKSKSVKLFPINKVNFNNTKFDFSPDEFKSIPNSTIHIELYHNSFMCSNLKGECTLKLNSLQSNHTIESKCNIQLLSKRIIPTIDIKVQIHQALSSKDKTTKEIFIVTKIFRSFK